MHLVVALLLLGKLSSSLEEEFPTIDSAAPIFKAIHGSERPTVVHFWAAWCKPCVGELPKIHQLAKDLLGLDASLLMVSLDDDPAAPAAVLGRFGVKGPNVITLLLHAPDPDPITRRFDPGWQAQLPATFVVLQSGTVVASHLGDTPVDAVLKEVRDRIDAGGGVSPPARRTK